MSVSAGRIVAAVIEAVTAVFAALAAVREFDLSPFIIFQSYFYDGKEPFFIVPVIMSFGIFVIALQDRVPFVVCLLIVIQGALLWGVIYFYVPLSYEKLIFFGVILNLFTFCGGLSLVAAWIWRRYP